VYQCQFQSCDAAAPSLICSKVSGWSTVTAAVSVAANEVVVELTNMSFAIFIVFDMKRCFHHHMIFYHDGRPIAMLKPSTIHNLTNYLHTHLGHAFDNNVQKQQGKQISIDLF
jgi:hypothetical protein